MAFTITGRLTVGTDPVSVSWDDGDLAGDDALIALAEARLEDPTPVAFSPLGPFLSPSLDEAEPAFALFLELLEVIDELTGDPPTLESEPDGVH